MKLIIDIPDKDYEEIMSDKKYQPRNLSWFERRIANGIPLDDIKAEIQKALDEDKATDTENAKVQAIALMWCLEVIDKHIGGDKE